MEIINIVKTQSDLGIYGNAIYDDFTPWNVSINTAFY
jgi:hypothetical protein